VKLDCVKESQPLFYGDYAVVLQTGTKLTLSRNYRDRLEKLLSREQREAYHSRQQVCRGGDRLLCLNIGGAV